MEEQKILRKYIQDKSMHYKEFRRLYLKDIKDLRKDLTDFERGYAAGICHALKEVNRDLSQDNIDIEGIVSTKIGTGLKWCRRK